MTTGRYVVVGLAPARAAWFRSVASWSNAASIPVEFVKCVSAAEVRAHLAGGRAFSALLVDAASPGLDRDLVADAIAAPCAVVVVDDGRVARDWIELGASATLPPQFDRKELLDALARHTTKVVRADVVPRVTTDTTTMTAPRARVAMVCGPGGTGTSTVAMALAQALGDDVQYGGMVLLADFARNGEQAMLHDARDVMPNVQDVVDAHRTGTPSLDDVRAHTFDVSDRRYDILLGLRRASSWSSIRPRAFATTFESLRRAWRVVVADTDADLEDEDDGGSADVEERNVMARATAARADVVLAVGQPGVKGVHSLARVARDLLDHGVPGERVVPIVNRAPRAARARSEIARTIAALADVAPAVFLPERRVDDTIRDGARLPNALTAPLAGAFHAVYERNGARRARNQEPEPVAPGSIGSWSV